MERWGDRESRTSSLGVPILHQCGRDDAAEDTWKVQCYTTRIPEVVTERAGNKLTVYSRVLLLLQYGIAYYEV